MQYLKQSTAVTLKIGPFIDDTDGKTAETGLTIAQADVRLSKNGGDIAQKTEATSCTHDELGIYGCPIDATDTATLGRLQLWVHESGALPVWHEFMVVTANIYDSLCSTDILQADLTQCGGSAVAAGAIPNAAADAAGGLPVSDAGNLDLDTKLANTNEITAARMGTLTDWINGGRLDLILDVIAADTTTDIPALIATAQADLDILTGADGATLATAQALYAPNVVVPDVAGTAATPAEVATALTDINLDHLMKIAVDTNWATTVHLDSAIGHLADVGTAATYDRTLESLEAIRARGDAAWTGGGVAPTVGQIRAEMEGAGYFLDLIKDDTDELQTDWHDGGRLDLIQDIIAADTTTDIPAILTAIEGATFDTATDSLEAIRDRGDAAWTGGGVAPTVGQIRAEMEGAGYYLALIKAQTDLVTSARMGTLTDWINGGRLDLILDIIAADTTTDIPAVLALMSGATFATGTDSLEAIRNRGDAAWSAAAGNPSVLIDTTIAAVTDQTHFTLTAGSDIDDAYKDQAIVLYDASNNDYPSIRKISAYTGATKTVTLDSASDFTIVPGDGIKTFVTAPGTTAPTAAQNADAVWDEARADHTDPTTYGVDNFVNR
jgi:hypothetical protein